MRATFLVFILFSLLIFITDILANPVKNNNQDLINNSINNNNNTFLHSINNSSSRPTNKNIPTEHIFRNDINNKKIFIIFTFLGISIFGAIVLSFVNVHYDFIELHNFYRGYMGRRLLIREGRLVYRDQTKLNKNQLKNNSKKKEKSENINGDISLVTFDDILSQTSPTENIVQSPDTTTSLILPAEQEAVGISNTQLEERMMIETVEASLGLPRSRQYIEDEGPEWRELDFYVDVGTPPPTFCLFFQQYDWSIYSGESLTTQEINERRNLLSQFRKWKKRKRKTFNIVVTERSRREMAEQEEEKNKKRTPPQA